MLISRVYLVRLDRRHDLDDLQCLKGTELVATRQHSTFHIRKNYSSDYILTTRRLAGLYNRAEIQLHLALSSTERLHRQPTEIGHKSIDSQRMNIICIYSLFYKLRDIATAWPRKTR
jgi:hypothetical protein